MKLAASSGHPEVATHCLRQDLVRSTSTKRMRMVVIQPRPGCVRGELSRTGGGVTPHAAGFSTIAATLSMGRLERVSLRRSLFSSGIGKWWRQGRPTIRTCKQSTVKWRFSYLPKRRETADQQESANIGLGDEAGLAGAEPSTRPAKNGKLPPKDKSRLPRRQKKAQQRSADRQ